MRGLLKLVCCFFIILCLDLYCYSDFIFDARSHTLIYHSTIGATDETIPTISYDTYEGITSEEKQELNTIIDNLLSHRQTKLLLEAIALQLKALKHEKQIVIKIVIQKNEEAKGHGCYCMNPCFFKQEDGSYKLYIYYSDLPQNGIYRPITFFLNGRYRMSYLEIPRYIAFAHESAHALNLLETIKNGLEKDLEKLTNEQNSKNVLEYLSKKIPLEESLTKNSFENLDELSVILGSFHTTSWGPCFLGETVFLRKHYKSISEQLHFWCWSHSLLEKKVLGPFEPNVESKFDCNIVHKLLSSLNFIEIKSQKQQEVIPLSLKQAWRIPNVNGDSDDKSDLIIAQQDGQFHNIDLSRLEKTETDITIETIEKAWGPSKRLIKKARIPLERDLVCVDEGQFCLFTLPSLKKQNLFFSKSGRDTVIYSGNLYIDSAILPLNIERLTDTQSIFSLPQDVKIKDEEVVDLCVQPFILESKDRIVVEGTQIQLKNVASDGNCGVWALLQALYPEQNFVVPTFSQVKDMERLRVQAATFVHNNNTTGGRIAMSAYWLYTDDFRYFAQAIGRPIGIIVYGDGYRIYEPSGNEIIHEDMLTFREYLDQHSETLKICLIGNHYQAVTNITSYEK